jgi:hypothetical protein
MIEYLGVAIGVYLCGIAIEKSLFINFLIAAIFCLGELILRFRGLYLYNKEQNSLSK